MKSGFGGMVAALAVLLAGAGLASAASAQSVEVREAWVRAPVPGQNIASAYMEIVSRAHGLLVAVTSPAAARAELHATIRDGDVMKMRQMESVDLPAGKVVKLAPGGMHIMLIDVKQPLKPGAKVPLTLTVQRDGNRSVQTVQATVRSASGTAGHQH